MALCFVKVVLIGFRYCHLQLVISFIGDCAVVAVGNPYGNVVNVRYFLNSN